jgi:hypothetical protein
LFWQREEINNRWYDVDEIFYSCSFLNPIFKKLLFLSKEKKNDVTLFIKSQIDKINIPNSNETDNTNEKIFIELFGDIFDKVNEFDEYEIYLNEFTKYDIDVFEYWRNNSKKFPKLSQVSKYTQL